MEKLNKLEMITGAMLWIDKNWSHEYVEELVVGMVSRGLKVARIFMFSDIRIAEDKWDDDIWDCLFDAAQRHGLYLTCTLCAGGVPSFIKKRYQDPVDGTIDNPEVWKEGLAYVEHIVNRYKNSPALHSWILWNEPSKETTPNRYTIPRFREYLRRVHNDDINLLKYRYCDHYTIQSFDDIGMIYEDGTGELPELAPGFSYNGKTDWNRFCIDDMNRLLEDIKRVVRENDPDTPITVNPCHVGWQLSYNGQDIWTEGEMVDFLGCSCHTCSYDRPLFDRKHQHLSLVVDAVRSATTDPEDVFWLTELQAGSIVYAGIRGFTPTGGDITHWLWEAFGSGARAVVYWLYSARESGYEGAEWGLVSQYEEDTERSIANAKVAAFLEENRDLFRSLFSPKPDVHILYSLCSEHLGTTESVAGKDIHGIPEYKSMDNARNYKLGGDGMFGAYSMAQDIGLHTGFVYENKISEMIPEDGILLCGNAYSLPECAVDDLQSFVSGGGTLIVDGLFALKDPWSKTAKDWRDKVSEIFGTRMVDIKSQQEPLTLDADGMDVPGWYVRCQFEEEKIAEEDVLARFPDGHVAAFRHRYGKGQAIWIGTLFFQKYTGSPSESACEFLRSILPQIHKPLCLQNPGKHLRLKRLVGDGEEVAVLLNYEDRKLARVFADTACTFTDMQTGEVFTLAGPGIACIPMPRESTRVLRVERS